MIYTFVSRKQIFVSFLLILFILMGSEVNGQQKIQKMSLSGRELCWAVFHPFIALKVKKITERALEVADSIGKAGVFHDNHGGRLDAFKHSFWMALLAQNIKEKKAIKLGRLHEDVARRKAKHGKGGGDKAASDMDLWNNNVGAELGSNNKELCEQDLIFLIIRAIQNGQMKIIRKNAKGQSLSCDGQLIDKNNLKTWNNKRCLVPSDYNYN